MWSAGPLLFLFAWLSPKHCTTTDLPGSICLPDFQAISGALSILEEPKIFRLRLIFAVPFILLGME